MSVLLVVIAIVFFEITVFVLILRSNWSGRTKAIASSVWAVFLVVLLASGAASSHPTPVAQTSLQTSRSEVVPSPTLPAASPTPTPRVTPTAKPPVTSPIAVPVAPAQTAVTFVNAPITGARGLNVTLQVRTSPNTSCSIVVNYKSGPSKAAGLGAMTSDAAGNVSWTWKVGGNTTVGNWPITVTCGNGSAQTHITVTLE